MVFYGMFYGSCQFGLDPHHLIKRSQGGHDVKENVLTLCRKHHDMAEEHLISYEERFGEGDRFREEMKSRDTQQDEDTRLQVATYRREHGK